MNIMFLIVFLASALAVVFNSPESFLPALLNGAKSAVTLSLTLSSVYAVWLGFLKILERCGILSGLSKILKPIISKIFKVNDENAVGLITINATANMLGMGGAATPAGVAAMARLEEIKNPEYSKAMLFVVNTASIQLLPATVIALRAEFGSVNPYNVLLPILLSSALSLAIGILLVKLLYGRKK